MKNKAWLFGGAAALALLAGGYAVAQSAHGNGYGNMRGMQEHSDRNSGEHRMGGRGGDERQGRMGQGHGRGEQMGRGGEGRGHQQGGRNEHAGRGEQGHQGMNHEGRGREAGMQGHGQRMQGMGGQEGRGGPQGRGPEGRGNGRGGEGHGMNHEGDRSRGNVGENAGRMGAPGAGPIDATRLDTLKTQIGVKPEQEAAWTTYSTAVKEAADLFRTRRESMDHEAVQKLAPADRFAFVNAQRDQARQQFDKVSAAAKDFTATLDDAQKAKARDLPGLSGPGAGRAGVEGKHRH